MLIGFVLLITIATAEPMPVSERIYPNKASCEQIKSRLLKMRPNAQIECSPVIRSDDRSADTIKSRKIDLTQN